MTPNPPPKSRDSAANSRAPPPRHPTIDLPTPTAPILHPTHHPVAPLLPTASHSTPMIPKRVGSTAQPMWGRGGPGVGGGGGDAPLSPLLDATPAPRCASAAQSSPWGRFIWEQTHLAPRWGGQRAAFISHALQAAPQGCGAARPRRTLPKVTL